MTDLNDMHTAIDMQKKPIKKSNTPRMFQDPAHGLDHSKMFVVGNDGNYVSYKEYLESKNPIRRVQIINQSSKMYLDKEAEKE